MKQHRITIWLFLALFFGFETIAQSQSIAKNEDGSINTDVAIEAFCSYLNNINDFSDIDSAQLIVDFATQQLFQGSEVKFKEPDFNGTYESKQQFDVNENCFKKMRQIFSETKKAKTIEPEPEETESKSHSWIWFVILPIVLLCAAFFFYMYTKRKKSSTPITFVSASDTNTGSNDIVVRRKTSSILRKQSLEDVLDNDNYMKIDCNDFCNDSAVRHIYIKNTCIKDIYNMYAEDLRNPDNPKEDGCMVLGRWVHDEETGEYYVSLEEIVLPGDDAVFTEYELNFGGKIKLKVSEKLRKLRRETELQYDLTCWVHSHPGLGVFFSNSDCNVQMQLKHPTQPKFLTAIVIDILTPQQDLGIFTFKHDMSINSKADIKKLYSLEEWYKWAVESKRSSFKTEDQYDTLSNAKSHSNRCHGIELTNGAVIDMDMLVSNPDDEAVKLVHGFTNRQMETVTHVVVKVSGNETEPDNELLGCFVMVSHCSIPSVRKAIADYLNKINFVMVYSTVDGSLTTIPVIFKDLCTDEKYYGEQQLEDLKIWTRRKR